MSAGTLQRSHGEALSRSARERTWTAAAHLEAVIPTAAMDEAQRSAWRRAKEVFPSDLPQWRQSAMVVLAQPEEAWVTPRVTRQGRRRIKEPGRITGAKRAGSVSSDRTISPGRPPKIPHPWPLEIPPPLR